MLCPPKLHSSPQPLILINTANEILGKKSGALVGVVVKPCTVTGIKRIFLQTLRGHLAKEELKTSQDSKLLYYFCVGSRKDGVMTDDINISLNLTSGTDLSALEE